MNLANSFVNALLADATYELKINDWNNKTGTDLEGAIKYRMTPTLAQYIGENFTVVTHLETGDVLGSGFDATVWRNDQSGELYISTQGLTAPQ